MPIANDRNPAVTLPPTPPYSLPQTRRITSFCRIRRIFESLRGSVWQIYELTPNSKGYTSQLTTTYSCSFRGQCPGEELLCHKIRSSKEYVRSPGPLEQNEEYVFCGFFNCRFRGFLCKISQISPEKKSIYWKYDCVIMCTFLFFNLTNLTNIKNLYFDRKRMDTEKRKWLKKITFYGHVFSAGKT